MLHMICHTCQQCDMRTPGMYDQQCTAVEMKVHIIRIGEVNTNDMHANTGNDDLNVKLWVGAKKDMGAGDVILVEQDLVFQLLSQCPISPP